MTAMENKKTSDFMVYFTFYKSVMHLIEQGRRDAAEALALEIVKYGTTGNRSQIFDDPGLEARMRSFIPYIDKSKQNCKETIARKTRRSSEVVSTKPRSSPQEERSFNQ